MKRIVLAIALMVAACAVTPADHQSRQATSGSLDFLVIGESPVAVAQRVKEHKPEFELMTDQDLEVSGTAGAWRAFEAAALTSADVEYLSRSNKWIVAGASADVGVDWYSLTFREQRLVTIEYGWSADGP